MPVVAIGEDAQRWGDKQVGLADQRFVPLKRDALSQETLLQQPLNRGVLTRKDLVQPLGAHPGFIRLILDATVSWRFAAIAFPGLVPQRGLSPRLLAFLGHDVRVGHSQARSRDLGAVRSPQWSPFKQARLALGGSIMAMNKTPRPAHVVFVFEGVATAAGTGNQRALTGPSHLRHTFAALAARVTQALDHGPA
jgi:hypothetical protein